MLKFMIQMGCFHFCFQKVDLYSLGIIFFEMCYRPLATGMERVKVLVNLRNSTIILPPDFTEDGRTQQIHIIRYILWFLYKFKLWIINLDINFTSDFILFGHHFIVIKLCSNVFPWVTLLITVAYPCFISSWHKFDYHLPIQVIQQYVV